MSNSVHVATYDVVNYPGQAYTAKVAWSCSCGKSGAVHDGIQAASLRRARSAFRRHATAATTKGTTR